MSGALRHLLWKDTRMIAPLVAMILAGTLTLNLLMCIAMSMFGYQSTVNLAVPLWILMPNFMAFGAPPMLVGSEEESGTLGWLRSLPAPWPMLVVSKTLVSLAAVLLSWAASSLLLWTTVAMWDSPLPGTLHSMLHSERILGLAFCTFQLLFIGFFLAYLCRSPILSLILVLPSMIGLMIAIDGVGWLLNVYPDPNGLWRAGRAVIAIAYVAFLVAGQFLPASWRLARRRSRKSASLPPILTVQPSQAYISNSLARVARPGMWRALLWQAWRQQSRPLIGLSIVACCTAVFWFQSFYFWSTKAFYDRGLVNFAFAGVLLLVCTWTGCLCFYPDSMSRRHFFFADRGFSKFYVWSSRVAAPTLGILVILFIIFALISFEAMQFKTGLLGSCALGFACGLLSSMWMTRSTLSFFVSPMLLLVIWVIHLLIVNPYQQYFGYVAIAALPLLFASWRLMDDWLKHEQDWTTQLRVAGYILLSVALIPVVVFTVRFGTMPKPLPQWRAAMLAQPMPNAFTETRFDSQSSIAGYLTPWLATHPLPIRVKGGLIDRPQLLWEETHGTLSSPPTGQKGLLERAESAQRILQWAKAARLAFLKGEISPNVVLQYAGSDERAAMSQMYNQLMSGVRPTPSSAAAIRAAMNEMASEELREKSWRMALAMEWRLYQSRRGRKVFAGKPVDVGSWLPDLEDIRADRNVDDAVYSALETPLADRPSPNIRAATRRIYGRSYDLVQLDIGDAAPQLKVKILQELKRRGL